MSPRRRRLRAAAAVGLIAAAPAAAALAAGDDSAPPSTPAAIQATRTVAEQVTTAWQVMPFGVTREGTSRTVWATGHTRAPSAAPAQEETGPSLQGDRAAADGSAPAEPSSATLLLEGVAANAASPTAYRRAAPPSDASGQPIPTGGWRVAGGERRLHAGEATSGGAAALLVLLGDDEPAILARRADGRFAVLPSPGDDALPAGTPTFDPETAAPFAVFDIPAGGDAGPATPGASPEPTSEGGAGATTPDAARTPAVDTGVLIAAPDGSGILRWNGSAWSKEPWLAADGTPVGAPQTPLALAATEDGDAVALVDAPAGERRGPRLSRRDSGGRGWREVVVGGSPLLGDSLPDDVTSASPVAAPGDPLTVTSGHWWVDLRVGHGETTTDVTVHLRPGALPAQPGEPTPSPAPATTAPEVTPAPSATPAAGTTPDAADAPASTPAGTTPAPSTTPAPDPAGQETARVTGTWCEPAGSAPATEALPDDLCDHELPAGFPRARGYRSQAFGGDGFGGRIITSPVIETGTVASAAARDASASGGYLSLAGGSFGLRSGVGDPADGTGGTEAAAFADAQTGWIGGRRTVGRIVPSAAADAGAAPVDRLGAMTDALLDVTLSPSGTAPDQAGALMLTSSFRLRRAFTAAPGSVDVVSDLAQPLSPRRPGAPAPADDASPSPSPMPAPEEEGTTPEDAGTGGSADAESDASDAGRAAGAVRRIVWARPDLVVAVGTAGLLRVGTPPARITRGGDDASEDPRLGVVPAAEGLDLVDAAFTASGPLEGWAIGRGGALVRADAGAWTRAALPEPLADADLRQIAYAGGTAYIASSAGPLVEQGGRFRVVPDLAAMAADDGRDDAGMWTVSALPDGTVVFDARYARDGKTGTWSRLPSPAEGDVIATSIGRWPVSGALRVVASVAEVRPALAGRPFDPERFGFDGGAGALAPSVTDGRLIELTPDGWVDRTRTALGADPGRDLTDPPMPVRAIALGDDGTGWAVGGLGSYLDSDQFITLPRGAATALGRPAETPAPPQPTPSARRASAAPAGGPVRVLVGGHPACLDRCDGRDDQGLAPTQTLREALRAAGRLAGDPAQRADALVIGGGRIGRAAPPMSRAGAGAYADLLTSEADAPPVLPAIGAGDAAADVGRANFASRVAAPLLDAATASGSLRLAPPVEAELPSDTVAYAVLAGAGSPTVRLIVIDNADGPLRGGIAGAQGAWLAAQLRSARTAGEHAIVVGAAALDGGSQSAADPGPLLDLLAEGGAAAYVSTNGSDDPYASEFGGRLRVRSATRPAGTVQLVHTSALGHALPFATIVGSDDLDFEALFADQSAPMLAELSVGQDGAVSVSQVPVFADFEPAEEPLLLERASASIVSAPTRVEADNGLRWTDPNSPGSPPVEARGSGFSDASPNQCRLFASPSDCGDSLPTDATFSIADPSIAVFVRARSQGKGSNRTPVIVNDPAGNPVQDASSPVICGLREGTTTATVTLAGQSTSVPIEVIAPRDGAPAAGGSRSCSFTWTEPEPAAAQQPAPAPAAPPAQAPAQPAAPPAEPPAKPPADRSPAKAAPAPAPALVAVPPFSPLARLTAVPAAGERPPVAPPPKPVVPPPAPPVGTGTQPVPAQVSAPVSQVVVARQEQRQREAAREGASLHAARYDAPAPSGDAFILGGAAALLTAAGGLAAGRRRALQRATARAWQRP